MKRKIALILCTALLLTGCNTPADSSIIAETAETETISEDMSDSTSEAADGAPAPAEGSSSVPQNTRLSELPISELLDFDLGITEDGRELIPLYDTVGDCMFRVSSDNFIELLAGDVDMYVRNSTRALKETPSELKEIVSAQDYDYHVYFDSGYDILWENPMLFFEDSFSDGLKMSSYRIGYFIPETITTKAFIKKDGENYHIIIDPAYTYGLPMLTSRTEFMTYDVNGTEIYADTLDFTASAYGGDLSEIGDDYVYAEIALYSLNVFYDTAEGYINTCTFEGNSVKVLSEDTDAVITSDYEIETVGKDPQMSEVYNAIMNDIDAVFKDNTYGMTLLDLDFDGTPELLVSDVVQLDTDNFYNTGVDVSVYRIKDGGLKYIDTIYNSHTVIYSIRNTLGLKTLADGSKAWFATSYKDRTTGELTDGNTDYLYTLEGDKLIATEVFGIHNFREVTSGDYTYTEYDYYFMGEKIVPEVIHEDITGMEGEISDTHLSWNGVYSYFGEMWELYGFARKEYCSDIEQSYDLYSDWLSVYSSSDYYWSTEQAERFELTERELSYNIAYLVDCFYLGTYNPAEHKVSYYFLGDYAKPVIYLYPEEETEVSVEVSFADGGEITCSYPEYNGGWTVTALPDGTLFDGDGNEYYCLYWEGSGSAALDMSRGWCVAGEDTAEFLREKLLEIGLTAREANEFIIYWLPLMQDNPYNIISLHTEQYKAAVPLNVSPAPDTEIRVFMTYTPSEDLMEIAPQSLPHYERNGFTLVEWGGGIAEHTEDIPQ